MSYETDFLEEMKRDWLPVLYESMEDEWLAKASENCGRELTDPERQTLLQIFAKFQIEFERLMEEEPFHYTGPSALSLLAKENELLADGMLAKAQAEFDKERAEEFSLRHDWWRRELGVQ